MLMISVLEIDNSVQLLGFVQDSVGNMGLSISLVTLFKTKIYHKKVFVEVLMK